MSAEKDSYYDCSFVSIHYIICECGETFPSDVGLKAHLEKEHPHKRERKEFKCGVCGLIYDTEYECIAHYEEAHIGEVKQEAEELSDEDVKPDLGEMINEEEEVDRRVLQIPEEFGEVVQEEDGQLVLVVKGIRRTRKDRAKKPRKKIHKDIICEVCGKKYQSNAALKYHQRIHTGERPFQCHLCPKAFTMPLFLQIHVRTHTGERPFPCPDCPKAFSNKAALLRHERVHTGEKPYGCPMCEKSFTQSNSMKLHVSTVHLKQPAPYKSKTRKLKAAEKLLNSKGSSFRVKNFNKLTNNRKETLRIKIEHTEEEQVEEEPVQDVVYDEEGDVAGEVECYEILYEQ